MAPEQQSVALRTFLFKKFTTDKDNCVMRPENPKRRRRADVSWSEFYMTEEELDEIVEAVLQEYPVARSALQQGRDAGDSRVY